MSRDPNDVRLGHPGYSYVELDAITHRDYPLPNTPWGRRVRLIQIKDLEGTSDKKEGIEEFIYGRRENK